MGIIAKVAYEMMHRSISEMSWKHKDSNGFQLFRDVLLFDHGGVQFAVDGVTYASPFHVNSN